MKQLSPKSITIMKYLGTDGEYHFVIVDDIMFPSLEDRLNYLNQLEYKLWANGEILSSIYGLGRVRSFRGRTLDDIDK